MSLNFNHTPIWPSKKKTNSSSMSLTPVSVQGDDDYHHEAIVIPVSAEDFQEEMQRMIALQNEQYTAANYNNTTPDTIVVPTTTTTSAPTITTKAPAATTTAPAVATSASSNNKSPTSMKNHEKNKQSSMLPPKTPFNSHINSIRISTSTTSIIPTTTAATITTTTTTTTSNVDDCTGDVVGKGTLIWNDNFLLQQEEKKRRGEYYDDDSIMTDQTQTPNPKSRYNNNQQTSTSPIANMMTYNKKSFLSLHNEQQQQQDIGLAQQHQQQQQQQGDVFTRNNSGEDQQQRLLNLHRQQQNQGESTSLSAAYSTKQNKEKNGRNMTTAAMTGYGGIEEQTPLDADVIPMPPGHHHHHNNAQYRQQQRQRPINHNDDDRYHDPIISETYDNHYEQRTSSSSNRNKISSSNRKNNCLYATYCCFYEPIMYYIKELIDAESLHRSFCYGAIDGMLTGAGIVSTFCGMNMLQLSNVSASSEIRSLVVVFTAATCFADSVCMALGHIWTTHVLASVQLKERSDARTQFLNNKINAKGILVDMLLQKGMLKIDAMSIADTLDGYPDLFVSALTGESLTIPSNHHNHQMTRSISAASSSRHNNTNNNNNILRHYSTSSFSGGGIDNNQRNLYDEGRYAVPGTDIVVSDRDESIMYTSSSFCAGEDGIDKHKQQQKSKDQGAIISSDLPTDTSSLTHLNNPWRGYSSYDHQHQHHYTTTERDMDPDAILIQHANQESRRESIFMMMGFSLFSIVPSLIYTIVPSLFFTVLTTDASNNVLNTFDISNGMSSSSTTTTHSISSSSGVGTNSASATFSMINPNTLAITLTALVMWCLGIWKSRFLDSNWLIFGIETVSVLFICIICAYGLGALLNHLFLPNEYEITVITSSLLNSATTTTTTKMVTNGMKHLHNNN